MDLFTEKGGKKDAVVEFRALLKELSEGGRSSKKNKRVEDWLQELTEWPTVGFKYVGDQKNLYNRIAEIENRPDSPRFALVLVPPKALRAARKMSRELLEGTKFDAIAIGSDSEPPALTDLFHAPYVALPSRLAAAFPKMAAHSVTASPGLTRSTIPAVTSSSAATPSIYPVAACARDTRIAAEVLESWLQRLERKKHLVLQGPPGTGKTYLAKHLAAVTVSGSQGAVEIVQFHPSYTYEDFVQGIRPSLEDGTVYYSVEPGRFLQFCERASKRPDAPFVLIIDELNRGNLSRIFGELLYLLEYRSESIPLAQGEKPFSVPANVRIIATMNTADRSIALIDHAFRRRFSFVFLAPDYDALTAFLADYKFDAVQLVEVLKKLNVAIGDRHYHVGTSFFLAAGSELSHCLREIWEGEIEPYLEEFFFDQPEKVAEFRWAQLIASDLSSWVGEP